MARAVYDQNGVARCAFVRQQQAPANRCQLPTDPRRRFCRCRRRCSCRCCHCAAAAAATLLLLLLAAAAAATGASAAAALLLLLPPPPPQLPLRLPRCSSGRVGQRRRGRWMVTAEVVTVAASRKAAARLNDIIWARPGVQVGAHRSRQPHPSACSLLRLYVLTRKVRPWSSLYA